MSLRSSTKRARAFSPSSASRLGEETEVFQKFKTANAKPISTEVKAPTLFTETADVTMKPRPFADLQGVVVELEGNIGSGKSTLSRLIRDIVIKETEEPDACSVFYETINNDFLAAFYTNIKKYSFAFQMYMLTTRLYQMDEGYRQADDEGRLVLLDRGAVGDTVFALLNHQMGNMNDEEIKIYKSVCQERMPASISERVDIVLYLDVDPAVCHRRVTTERKNDAEEGIPLAYLDAVDNCYFHILMDWFGNRKGSYHELNVGKSPEVIVVRWENYGDARESIATIQSMLAGNRRSPTVAFQADQPTEVDENTLVINTEEDVATAFASINSGNSQWSLPPMKKAQMNWDLEHSNSFRRVAMYFLSIQGDVTFFGASTDTTKLS